MDVSLALVGEQPPTIDDFGGIRDHLLRAVTHMAMAEALIEVSDDSGKGDYQRALTGIKTRAEGLSALYPATVALHLVQTEYPTEDNVVDREVEQSSEDIAPVISLPTVSTDQAIETEPSGEQKTASTTDDKAAAYARARARSQRLHSPAYEPGMLAEGRRILDRPKPKVEAIEDIDELLAGNEFASWIMLETPLTDDKFSLSLLKQALRELAHSESLSDPDVLERYQRAQKLYQRRTTKDLPQRPVDPAPIGHYFLLPALLNLPAWQAKGACLGADAESKQFDTRFFPSSYKDEDAPKLTCRTCPVLTDCLLYAMDTNQPDGVWGGMTRDERIKLKRRLNRKHEKLVKADNGSLQIVSDNSEPEVVVWRWPEAQEA